MDRRHALASVARAIGCSLVGAPALALAQASEFQIGLVAPLSGPYAKQGDYMLKGARLAVEQINAAGGIRALGGAKIALMVADAGDSVERAKAAAQRLMADHPNLSAGTGAFLSSFTLAVTDATERAELPWLTNSITDQIVSRGFQYVFQTSPQASRLARESIPTLLELGQSVTGRRPGTVGFVLDNTAFAGSFAKPVRDGGLAPLRLTVDETITPPLSDATAMVQKIRASRPDFLMALLSSTNDNKLLLEKLGEFNLGRGRLPVVALGSQSGSPELRNLLGAETLEGLLVIVMNWGSTRTKDVVDAFRRATGEPWMTQDSIDTYAAIQIIKEAAEVARSSDRRVIGRTLHTIDTREGAARLLPGGHIKFDEAGRMVNPAVIVLQWQKGEPVPVFPAQLATAKANWGAQ